MEEGETATPQGLSAQHVRIAAAVGRYQAITRAMPALWVIAAWVPIQAITPIARALAGRHTSVSVVFSLSITFSIVIGGSLLVQRKKIRAQAAELIRLRARCDQLEAANRQLMEART